jgi:hypothetical protein
VAAEASGAPINAAALSANVAAIVKAITLFMLFDVVIVFCY